MEDLSQTTGIPVVLRSPERTWLMIWDRKLSGGAIAALRLPNIRKSLYSQTH